MFWKLATTSHNLVHLKWLHSSWDVWHVCVWLGSLQLDAHHNRWNPAATHQHSTICTSHAAKCFMSLIIKPLIRSIIRSWSSYFLNTELFILWIQSGFWLTLSIMNSEKQLRSWKRLGRNTCMKRFIVVISWLYFANCRALFELNYMSLFICEWTAYYLCMWLENTIVTCIKFSSVWHRHCIWSKLTCDSSKTPPFSTLTIIRNIINN